MTRCAIECTAITEGLDGVPALRNITAKFATGAVTVLAGENGTGKSTLCKIIAGQLRPDSGIILLLLMASRSITSLPAPLNTLEFPSFPRSCNLIPS